MRTKTQRPEITHSHSSREKLRRLRIKMEQLLNQKQRLRTNKKPHLRKNKSINQKRNQLPKIQTRKRRTPNKHLRRGRKLPSQERRRRKRRKTRDS